jgi:Na+-driven multidrug efflux pump
LGSLGRRESGQHILHIFKGIDAKAFASLDDTHDCSSGVTTFSEWFLRFMKIGLPGCMQGAGYIRLPMVIIILCFGVLRLLIALYLTNFSTLGANGTWIAMASTSVLAGVLMALAFKWGRWKHQIV